jgi:hypothetical protein
MRKQIVLSHRKNSRLYLLYGQVEKFLSSDSTIRDTFDVEQIEITHENHPLLEHSRSLFNRNESFSRLNTIGKYLLKSKHDFR